MKTSEIGMRKTRSWLAEIGADILAMERHSERLPDGLQVGATKP